MLFLLPISALKTILPVLAIIAGLFVITTKNPIISVFNLIVLYILVAFYLIYIGITYLGISYIIIYIGAIAILFLFVIMMIDIEVVEKRNNNYLPLLFLLLSGFLFTLKKILFNIGIVKMRSLSFKKERFFINQEHEQLFNLEQSNFIKLKEEIKSVVNFSMSPNYDFNNNIGDIEDNNIPYDSSEENLNWTINNSKGKVVNYNINNEPLIEYAIKEESHYLLINPDWNSAASKITQVSAVGDVLYTVYHSYIYIVSVILLLGMVGAIILTTDSKQEINILSENKKSSIVLPLFFIKEKYLVMINIVLLLYKNIIFLYKEYINKINFNNIITNYKSYYLYTKENWNKKRCISIPSFFLMSNNEGIHTEGIIDNLVYFIIANLIIALLLLSINSYFSISVKYLDKGGGFECGFTSFVQTRERFNVIFYRVSLLFLVFDLEIILAFPYTAIYQKSQNISKNNILAFIYILVIGFVYELKEGALNIVKKAHSNESK
jgi:NADH-ubiquinone oxidoreductase chain 6